LGAKDLCRALLTQSLPADPELAEHLRRTIDSIVTEIYIFVCCFSEEGDLLSQWRAYCPQGGGVSLGFDPIELRDIASGQGFTLVKCIYDESRAIALLNAIIQDAVVSRQAGTPLEKISQSFLGWFFQIAPAIKNRSFWEEREWRLVSLPKWTSDQRVRYREGDTLITPYFEVDLAVEGKRMQLMEAYTGPTRYADIAPTTISNLLRSQLVDCRQVNPTRSSFRI
jgi:hypothetical protein